MATCSIKNCILEDEYNCDYAINNEISKVAIDYNYYTQEEYYETVYQLEHNNKTHTYDILIKDPTLGNSILLKKANYTGSNTIIGLSGHVCHLYFESEFAIQNDEAFQLENLQSLPYCKSVRIYSPVLYNFFYNDRFQLEDNQKKKEYLLHVDYSDREKIIEIGKENIRKIIVSDNLLYRKPGSKNVTFSFTFTKYLEIKFFKRVQYYNLCEFINELTAFVQLYIPNRFSIDKIETKIDDEYYQIYFPHYTVARDTLRPETVNTSLLEFLCKCYEYIPLRLEKRAIRNIPYVIFNSDLNVEDKFLVYYKFIECYYKLQPIPNIKKSFIKYSLDNNYIYKYTLDYELDKLVREIISLRNHYTHSGYYLKNASLKISFRGNPSKNYTVTNIDKKWIEYRVNILKKICMDIIYRNMLHFQTYDLDYI